MVGTLRDSVSLSFVSVDGVRRHGARNNQTLSGKGLPAMARSEGIRLPAPQWVVSVDFGTKGSGFAIKRASAPIGLAPLLHESWPDQPEARYPKDLTATLYRGREPIAIGWHARKLWLGMDAGARSSHTFVECFKLALKDPARAALPSWLTAEQAIGDYLSLLRAYAMDLFDDLYAADPSPPSEETIQWCLTVPALWDEASKQAMRRAALRAGLITTFNSSRLTLILEPEAAVLHALVHRAPPLQAGMNVMVVDVGGGTTDVTVHACREVGGQVVLSEKVVAEGALCGAVLVDEAFRAYYRDCVGASTFDTWATQHPEELARVVDKWEVIKRAFGAPPPSSSSRASSPGGSSSRGRGGSGPHSKGSPTSTLTKSLKQASLSSPQKGASKAGGSLKASGSIGGKGSGGDGGGSDDSASDVSSDYEMLSTMFKVFIPPRLHALMSASDKERLRRMQGGGADSDVVLDNATLAELFSRPVQAIVGLAQQQMEAAHAAGFQLSMVLLVGGFARSPFLQARIRHGLELSCGSTTPPVVVPPVPHAAVLNGAVVYGSDPSLIRARRSKNTYGVRTCGPHVEGAPTRWWHQEEGCFYTDSFFHTFVTRNEEVGQEQEVLHLYEPCYKDQRRVAIELLASAGAPEFIRPSDPDIHRMATLYLDLDDSSTASENAPGPSRVRTPQAGAGGRMVRVKLRFGATELMATAEDVHSERDRQLTIKFASI